MEVIKLDGSRETYDPKKIAQSLKRSGADKKTVKKIVDHIEHEIHDGITTQWIYNHAMSMLRKEKSATAVTFRYSLRRAITEFGPSGFPFEKFMGEVFRLRGYDVRVGYKAKGSCVTHEVDLYGKRENEVLTAELKFHNKLKIKSDLQTALYVHARFDDLERAGFYGSASQKKMIITNTKFSQSAVRYGECIGLELVGWNHPKRGPMNLHDLIQDSGIHPLTCLSTLSKKQKTYFLEQGVVLCSELSANNFELLHNAESVIQKHKLPKIIDEIADLCECVGPACEIDK